MNEREFNEHALKFQARAFLIGGRIFANRLVFPTQEEWIGLNLLMRDDEIKKADWKPPKKTKN